MFMPPCLPTDVYLLRLFYFVLLLMSVTVLFFLRRDEL